MGPLTFLVQRFPSVINTDLYSYDINCTSYRGGSSAGLFQPVPTSLVFIIFNTLNAVELQASNFRVVRE